MKTRVTINLDDQDQNYLSTVALALGMKQTDVIRQAIVEFHASHADDINFYLQKQMGLSLGKIDFICRVEVFDGKLAVISEREKTFTFSLNRAPEEFADYLRTIGINEMTDTDQLLGRPMP